MPLNKNTLKNAFETALNTQMELLQTSTDREYYKTVNDALAQSLTDAIDTYIKAGTVTTTVSTAVTTAGSATNQAGAGTGTGTGNIT